MAIYSAPEEIKPQDFDVKDWQAEEDRYTNDLRTWIMKTKAAQGCKEAGRIISMPYADGAAYYMIISLKPVKLVHMAIGDAWDYPYMHRLTAADIRQHLLKEKIMKEFSKPVHINTITGKVTKA